MILSFVYLVWLQYKCTSSLTWGAVHFHTIPGFGLESKATVLPKNPVEILMLLTELVKEARKLIMIKHSSTLRREGGGGEGRGLTSTRQDISFCAWSLF